MKNSTWIKIDVNVDSETILNSVAQIKAHVEAIEEIARKLFISDKALTVTEGEQSDNKE